MNKQYQPLAACPIVEEAGKEWAYQQSRIRKCREIIASAPGTPKARNAQRLIDDINMQLGVS